LSTGSHTEPATECAPWEEDLRQAMHFHARGETSQAAEIYRALLSKFPALSRAAYNLGNILKDKERYEEAEQAYLQALGYEPELYEAALNLAISLQEQGRFDEALRISAALILHWPGIPDSYFIHGCLLLLTGDYPQGWEAYEYRFECLNNPVPRRHQGIPEVNGALPEGATVLLSAEQGFGDTLQMLRYIPFLLKSGYRVWLEVSAPLVPLCEQIQGISGVIPKGAPLPEFDAHIPIMSLPRQFGTTPDTIPPVLTIVPAAALVSKMTALLPPGNRFKVGLAWSGRLNPPINRKRSCPPALISQLLDLPGITFVSLQKETSQGFELNDPRLLDLSGDLLDFHHTAALISSLDLVITIDTSIVHLAGTMGCPTWLLLPFVPDWRWHLDRDDSPWYPSIQLFRQPSRGDWQSVITRTMLELASRLPDSACILSDCGVLAEARGASSDALYFYQKALKYDPNLSITRYNMGNSLKHMGRIDESRDCYEEALRLRPDFPEAHHNLAIVARDMGDITAACRHCEAALSLKPDFADALHTMGELYQHQERFGEAVEAFKRAIAADSLSARSWNSLGITRQSLELDSGAEPCYREALRLDPGHLHARNNLGAVLLTLGRIDESIQVLKTLVDMAPDYHDGRWNLACSLIAAGEWSRGWEEFEFRFLKHSPVQLPRSDLPLWDGSPLNGRGILVQGEQAFGDVIQFIRFAASVAARGGIVHVVCQHPALTKLVAMADGVSTAHIPSDPLPGDIVCRAPIMSLPHVLGVTLDQLPATVPYMTVPADLLAAWREKIPTDAIGIRVGICWSGRQTLRNRRRSCPPDLLSTLGDIPGISMFSLQIGATSPPPGLSLIDLTEDINDFADSAALLTCLDLIITIDTAVAHLAGALGRPVWLMLPDTVDWRWMAHRTDSPWYPTMLLFRPSDGRGWQGVISQVAEKLRMLANPRVYVYRPGVDFPEHPDLGERLTPLQRAEDRMVEGITATMADEPELADMFLFPYYLENLTEWATINGMCGFVENLPCFGAHEAEHLFFSDHDQAAPYHTSAWWFRTSIDPLHRDPGSIPLAYHCEDLAEYLDFDSGTLRYHVSFIGYLGHRKQRAPLIASFPTEPHLTCHIEVNDSFYGHLTPDERQARRTHYLETCSHSLCILCPTGEGSNSIRFFEALSLGRLPVLISDTPLPFEDTIPYHRFVLRIPPDQAGQGGALLVQWLSGMGSEDPMVRCREARKTWEEWFSPEAMPRRLWTELLRRRCRRNAPPHSPTPAKAPASSRSPDTYLENGRTASREGNAAAAESAFIQAISYDHRCYEAYLELGRLMAAGGRDHQAVERFYEASLVRPDAADPFREALPCLERLGRETDAEYCREQLSRASASHPSTPDKEETDRLMDSADACREAEQWEEALARYLEILRIDPDNGLAQLRAGGSLIFLNRHAEAVAHLDRAAALLPESPEPHINLAFCYLSSDNWQQGWEEFEWRRHYISEDMPPIPELHRLAPNERLDGKRLLIHTEQGFGDLLQFCRYVPALADLGAIPIFSVPETTASLLQSLGEEITIIPHGTNLPACDFQTLLQSLPDRLIYRYPKPLCSIPYLRATPPRIEAWKERLASLPGLKVGIAWQGRDMRKSGYRRSLQPEQLRPLFEQCDCSFISLHPEPLADCRDEVIDVSAGIRDFGDTAALISCLDLVITIDTSVAHLAGALGIPCWVMLLHAPDWRWFPLESDESPWYPTLRLFRQETHGDWDGVVARITMSLREELLTRQAHKLQEAGKEQEALECFRAATGHRDATSAAWLNLGVALHRQGETGEGCKALQQAVRLDPHYPEAWQNMGLLQQSLGLFNEAYCSFQRALRLRPDYPTARWNLSLLQLLIGDYEHGWANFEARFAKQPPVASRHGGIPRWRGESLAGRRLLIHAEQGYGDTIQFLRFVPILAQTGAEIVLEVQDDRLRPLALTLDSDCTIITRAEPAPKADLQIPLMSIPAILGITPETVPNTVPYLFPDPEKVSRWGSHLEHKAKLRIGLVWKGRDEHVNDRFRSCPLELFVPLFELPGIAWYSLQVGAGRDQMDSRYPLHDPAKTVEDFGDTAAIMSQLDMIISVDTAVAHLSGALGCTTWLLLPFAPDWRWGVGSDRTPWYPSMRLFRQQNPGNWNDVMDSIEAALRDLVVSLP